MVEFSKIIFLLALVSCIFLKMGIGVVHKKGSRKKATIFVNIRQGYLRVLTNLQGQLMNSMGKSTVSNSTKKTQ